jgi:hypothetical protein
VARLSLTVVGVVVVVVAIMGVPAVSVYLTQVMAVSGGHGSEISLAGNASRVFSHVCVMRARPSCCSQASRAAMIGPLAR